MRTCQEMCFAHHVRSEGGMGWLVGYLVGQWVVIAALGVTLVVMAADFAEVIPPILLVGIVVQAPPWLFRILGSLLGF
ncbi:hypothetical protein ACFOWE_32110 [Planomonospora corallina]|uniref:AI-2E family transporter n=1 Tax=Planomonospora corallina TaxID=1806052 RepID=A0ABV8IIL0_9ACTN